MDWPRIGRSIRALRIRAGKRQQDVAEAAGVSRSFVAKVEAGTSRSVDLRRLEDLCHALGADLDIRVRWRGDLLDRLLDEAHANLVEQLTRRLDAHGWEIAIEVSFNEYGERGSVDVLAYHAQTEVVVVFEVKTVIADAQDMVAKHDRKTRLAPKLASARG